VTRRCGPNLILQDTSKSDRLFIRAAGVVRKAAPGIRSATTFVRSLHREAYERDTRRREPRNERKDEPYDAEATARRCDEIIRRMANTPPQAKPRPCTHKTRPDVHFNPTATELPERSEMTRRATSSLPTNRFGSSYGQCYVYFNWKVFESLCFSFLMMESATRMGWGSV
jgi:hypothetical protein